MDRSAERGEGGWRSEGESAVHGGGLWKSERGSSEDEEISVRHFANSSPLGIVVTRGESLVIRYLNPAFRRLLGMEGDLALGLPFENVLSAPAARRIAVLLRRVYRTGSALCDVEMRLREGGASGDARKIAGGSWQLTAWRLPAERGGPTGIALLVRDGSAAGEGRGRQQAMAELREINQRLLVASLRELELTERAEAANEAKSAFLATMSHELRTPLTAILGYEELLAEGVTGPMTEVQQKHLSRIKLGAEHLLTLIDGILTLARLDANREAVRIEPVAADRLLDEARTLVAPLASSKQLKFTVQRSESPLVVDTDHTKVRQILVNVVGNAVKFTERGEIMLGARAEGDSAVFTVRDTGIGVAKEHLEHIFDSFWQVEQTTTRTVGGSGLGLSVSRRLARLLGGDLTVQSTPGMGSEFTLRLPLHRL